MEIATGTFYFAGRHLRPTQDFFLIPASTNAYEVLRIMGGLPLFLEDHLERLDKTLAMQHLPKIASKEELRNRIMMLSRRCGILNGNIKLLVNGPRLEDLSLYFIPHHYPDENLYGMGVPIRTLYLERESPNAKVQRRGYRDTIRHFMKSQDIYEALLVNREGFITEGSRSNVFFLSEGVLVTPPLKEVLGGVTRRRVLELARTMGIPLREESLHIHRLPLLEGAFLTGTSPKILPIRSIDEVALSSSEHPRILALMKAYDALIEQYLATHRLP